MTESLFADWEYRTAELLKVNTRGTEYEPVDVKAAVAEASSRLGITADGGDKYVVPLFSADGPTPTNEYVLYKPATEQITWFDTGFGSSGTERRTACEKVSTTVIAHRLRYWLPENLSEAELDVDEDELPPETVDPVSPLDDAEQTAFFDELNELVRTEKEAEREQNWERYDDLGLEAAISRNHAAGPFTFIRKSKTEDGRSAYLLQLVQEEDDEESVDLTSDEGIYYGNHVVVDVEFESTEFPIEAEVTSLDGPTLTVCPRRETLESEAEVRNVLTNEEVPIWISELLNPVPYERRTTAIRTVANDDQKRGLLTGNRPVGFSVNKYATPNSAIELNERQELALIWADGADDLVCIHGPPGTGKTRTLTAYIKHAVDRGQSVLVAAHSNQAVDNLLVGDSTPDEPEEGTLHALAQAPESDFRIARAGSNSRNRVVTEQYTGTSLSAADVVAATTSGAAQFDQNRFDVAVVDEATQASRPATAIVLNCAQKLVLAGDHKQLPPYCADESMQEEEMHISLFEYLLNRYGDEISVLLPTQYRMHEDIVEFPNEAFYDGQLETADRNRHWSIGELKPLMGIDITGGERRETTGNSFYNQREAEAAAKQVKLLDQSGVDAEDIGVITAYTGQKRKIEGELRQIGIANPHRVSVDTVDSFQGGEREAIIVSFVRSNDDGHSGFLEFPDEGPRRLNVALTRARKRLVLIGDWATLGTVAPHRTPAESCADLYAELASHIRNEGWMLNAGR